MRLCGRNIWSVALRETLDRIAKAGLTVRPSQCLIGAESLDFIGHHIGKGIIKPDKENIRKVRNVPRPTTTKKELRSFRGLAGFYRDFVPNFSAIAVPLTDPTKKGQPNRIEWKEAQEAAYRTLKNAVTSKPVLHLPDHDKSYTLRVDAVRSWYWAVLLQEHDNSLFPVGYGSKKLMSAERRYSTIERECLAVIWAIRKFHPYLYGREFWVQMDHQPLQYLNRAKYINDRIMRWALYLQGFNMKMEANKERENDAAEFLSRSIDNVDNGDGVSTRDGVV